MSGRAAAPSAAAAVTAAAAAAVAIGDDDAAAFVLPFESMTVEELKVVQAKLQALRAHVVAALTVTQVSAAF
jgi:hypothetical protein